jgi:hypothetical protein
VEYNQNLGGKGVGPAVVSQETSIEPTGGSRTEETTEPLKKKEDEIKKIDVTQCFGPAFCLTN